MILRPLKILSGSLHQIGRRSHGAAGLVCFMASVFLGGCFAGESSCRGVDVDQAWKLYSDGRVDEAHAIFQRAVDICPRYADGQLGLGYTALRRGQLELAQQMFETVIERKPKSVDGLVGSGLVHWRRSEFEQARHRFQRAYELDPTNEQAREYLARFPETGSRSRAPRARSDTLVYPARVTSGGFEVRGAAGWQPFYVKGVNIGAALPGGHASVFPDSATYATWLRLIGAMDANTIRVYTMHPPHFYQALLDYNRENAHAPLWLLQGVWAELPPDEINYDHRQWKEAFYSDMRTVVDMIHGQADVELQAGRTSGTYTADVSPWTLGYILGREWEAKSVLHYNRREPGARTWSGRYVEVKRGSAMDVWLAKAIDVIVDYETTQYGAQRPVAYTNWPPTDAIDHPSEADLATEQRVRRALGDPEKFTPVLDGDDAVGLDPTLILTKPAFQAGQFASYHVYPYYPDFLVLDPELNGARSPLGPSNYWGYLLKLKQAHGDMPVLVAEYGISTAVGIAHFQPQGWHHGGNTEAEMAAANAQLTREIAAAGMAGGILFEWIDEWFKKTWNTEPLELPRERDPLWYNRMDPEENYGVLAIDPLPSGLRGLTPEDRARAWASVRPLFRAPSGLAVSAVADAAYLRLHIDFGGAAPPEALIGFDVIDSSRGEFRWPGHVGDRLPVGLEFVVRARPDTVRLLVHAPYNPVRITPFSFKLPTAPTFPEVARKPPGFFTGAYMADMRRGMFPRVSTSGSFEPLQLLPNRVRFAPDSTAFSAAGYEWGVLPRGAEPDGLWQWSERTLELRIPWQLLNVADPSQRRVIADSASRRGAEIGTATIPGIRVLVGVQGADRFETYPPARRAAEVPLFAWNPWDAPRWKARIRPTFGAVKSAWQTIGPRPPQVAARETRSRR